MVVNAVRVMTTAACTRHRRLFAILTMLLMAGCATLPPPVSQTPVDLARINQWQARGRIAVSGGEAGGGSGSFDWQQHDDRADVQIRGPLGIGSVELEVSGSAEDPAVRLQTANGATLESQAAWDELENRLGAAVPAGSLRFWMLGRAAPGEHRWSEPDPQGVTTLEQDGWRIDYQKYSDAPGARVPIRISATSGDARVRILIDRWQLGQ